MDFYWKKIKTSNQSWHVIVVGRIRFGPEQIISLLCVVAVRNTRNFVQSVGNPLTTRFCTYLSPIAEKNGILEVTFSYTDRTFLYIYMYILTVCHLPELNNSLTFCRFNNLPSFTFLLSFRDWCSFNNYWTGHHIFQYIINELNVCQT